MAHPQRTPGTYWSNDVPFTNAMEVLYILATKSTTSDPHYMEQFPHDLSKWEIIVHWWNDRGYGSGGYTFYQVDSAVAEKLKTEQLIEPRRVKYVGGFITRRDEFVITPKGREMLDAFEANGRETALRLLKPGIHTDLVGEPWPKKGRLGREHMNYGRLYVEFSCPNDTVCRIYPDTEEVVFPYPPPGVKTAAA